MKNTCIFIVLFSVTNAFGQYKRFSLGVNYASNLMYTKHPDKLYPFPRRLYEFSQSGALLQYNFKSVFSLALEPAFENTRRNSRVINVYAPQYIHWRYRYESWISHRLTVPVMAKATFGKKFLVTPAIGVNYSFLLPISNFQSVEYSIYDDFQKEPIDQVKVKVKPGDANVTEFNVVWGVGFAYQVHEKWLFSIESRFLINSLRQPKDRDNFSSYPYTKIMFTAAYQLNFKKESAYKFSTYRLKFDQAD